MSQTAIPLEFERYLQNQMSAGDAPDMNEMIFAYIPRLDPSQPIDRENGLPDASLWVYQQDIEQVGKLGNNALAYSVVISGTVSRFTFNAIYLRDKNVPNSCGMVVHKANETKENGMASTKSLVQAYDGAAQIAGITIDASTWQIDYHARLKGMEEEHRLACLDNYGRTAFIEGFDVTQQADPNKYKVNSGVVYVGGLRGVLNGEVLQSITTKPSGLYIDVVRQGTALSVWENKVTILVSATELTDYVDGNGEQHYVAKLAGINADGSVVDWRVKGGLALAELKSNAAKDEDIDSESTANKYIKIPQFWRGIKKFFTDNPVGTSSELVVTQKALSNFRVGFGAGQTWHHPRILTERNFNVRYTNTNNFPIQVSINFRPKTSTGPAAKFFVDHNPNRDVFYEGHAVHYIGMYYPGNGYYSINVIIPPGSEYWLAASNSHFRILNWSELR